MESDESQFEIVCMLSPEPNSVYVSQKIFEMFPTLISSVGSTDERKTYVNATTKIMKILMYFVNASIGDLNGIVCGLCRNIVKMGPAFVNLFTNINLVEFIKHIYLAQINIRVKDSRISCLPSYMVHERTTKDLCSYIDDKKDTNYKILHDAAVQYLRINSTYSERDKILSSTAHEFKIILDSDIWRKFPSCKLILIIFKLNDPDLDAFVNLFHQLGSTFGHIEIADEIDHRINLICRDKKYTPRMLSCDLSDEENRKIHVQNIMRYVQRSNAILEFLGWEQTLSDSEQYRHAEIVYIIETQLGINKMPIYDTEAITNNFKNIYEHSDKTHNLLPSPRYANILNTYRRYYGII